MTDLLSAERARVRRNGPRDYRPTYTANDIPTIIDVDRNRLKATIADAGAFDASSDLHSPDPLLAASMRRGRDEIKPWLILGGNVRVDSLGISATVAKNERTLNLLQYADFGLKALNAVLHAQPDFVVFVDRGAAPLFYSAKHFVESLTRNRQIGFSRPRVARLNAGSRFDDHPVVDRLDDLGNHIAKRWPLPEGAKVLAIDTFQASGTSLTRMEDLLKYAYPDTIVETATVAGLPPEWYGEANAIYRFALIPGTIGALNEHDPYDLIIEVGALGLVEQILEVDNTNAPLFLYSTRPSIRTDIEKGLATAWRAYAVTARREYDQLGAMMADAAIIPRDLAQQSGGIARVAGEGLAGGVEL